MKFILDPDSLRQNIPDPTGSGSTTLVTPHFYSLGADYGPGPEWDTRIPRRWHNAQDLQSQLHERKCFFDKYGSVTQYNTDTWYP